MSCNEIKLFTDEKQTAELVRLDIVVESKPYSIGELIALLPPAGNRPIEIEQYPFGWRVMQCYLGCEITINTMAQELIDALFLMVVELKKRGEI